MPETTKTTVTRNANGQYQVTIPKAIGDGFELEGLKLEWKPVSGSRFEVEIHDNE